MTAVAGHHTAETPSNRTSVRRDFQKRLLVREAYHAEIRVHVRQVREAVFELTMGTAGRAKVRAISSVRKGRKVTRRLGTQTSKKS